MSLERPLRIPLDTSMTGTRLTFNSFPIIPSPRLSPSTSAPDRSTSGSSFKPLRLSSHPWVRAHARAGSNDIDKPRLSFLALHYHMHGADSFSQPEITGAPRTPGIAAGIRRSPEGLTEALGAPMPTPSPSYVSRVQMRSCEMNAETGYFGPSASAVPTETRPPPPHHRGKSTVETAQSAAAMPNMSRSASAPAPAPVASSSLPPPTPAGSHKHNKSKRHRKKPPPPLGVAAFSGAFAGVLTTSDNLFGEPTPARKRSEKRTKYRLNATDKWVKEGRERWGQEEGNGVIK